MTFSSALALAAAFLAGAALGYVHFATLHAVTRGYTEGRAARAGLLQFARLGVLVAALVVLARLGAGPLLAGTLGLLAARVLVLRKARREP